MGPVRVLFVLVAAALLAGCGAEPPPGPASRVAAPVEAATPQAWTGTVCGALVPVVARLTAAPGLDLGAPDATRQAYLTYLDEGLAATDRARTEIAAAGPAPVPGGDVIAEQVRGHVADLRADLAEARDQVQRTDTGSAVAFGRALVGVTQVVSALLNGAEVAGTVNRDPTLKAAYAASPSCAQLQRSGRPGTA
ncbi:MAG: hypothetical protein JNM77_01925, partial [Pseudonocardia sp.]|nr:hypothetical protein [Pseudonocardia sp.]